MKSKKILTFLIFIGVIATITAMMTLPGKTKVKSYYSGDAINYNEKLVVVSTDSESLEVFTQENTGLERRFTIRPFDERFNKDDSFYGVKLNIENGHLYAYTISGYTLYKYDISSLNKATLIKKDKNTYWEWYNKVDKFGNNIVTISAKGIKVFNNDLQVIDSYNITNDVPYNISSGGDKDYIFNLKGKNDVIEVFSREQRSVVNDLQINFYGGENNRSIYFDAYDNNIYFADDYSVKKISLKGELKGTFEHLGYPGYDVSSSGNEYLYFANGLGVVKIQKNNMSVATSRRTGNISVAEGWAMGLKAVATKAGERVVVFNNSSILVMDSNLKVLGSFTAGKDDKIYAKENLFLNLSSGSVDSGSQVEVTGGGFFSKEKLIIDFYGKKCEVTADKDGRFSKILNVPELSDSNSRNKTFSEIEENGMEIKNITERTDIKVTGDQSKYTYSISLYIKDAIIK
jgi:hypothetical protein